MSQNRIRVHIRSLINNMKRRVKMKKILALILCFGILAAFSACGSEPATESPDAAPASDAPASEAPTSEPAKETYTFAFLSNTLNNTFQSTMSDTFQRLCDENGYNYVFFDPDYDVNLQLSQMEDVANQQVDAVFLIPTDSAGVRLGLEAINSKGIPVLNVDTPVIDEDLELVETVIATDAYQAGVLVGEAMAEKYPDGGKIAILDLPENESCVDRVNGFLAGLGDNADKYEIVAQQNGMGSLDVSLPLAEDIIQANPDLLAFFCINDPSGLGAVAALKAANKEGVGVFCIDASPDGKAALVDGEITGLSAQCPIVIAETAFDRALKLLAGEEIEEEILVPSYIVTVEMAEETAGQWQ